MNMKLTDLMRGQMRSISHDDVAKKVAAHQVLPPPGPLRVTAWEDSGMTRSVFLHKADNISSPCYAVVHDLGCRWLILWSEWATRDREMQGNSEHAASGRPRTGGLARILLC